MQKKKSIFYGNPGSKTSLALVTPSLQQQKHTHPISLYDPREGVKETDPSSHKWNKS